jgi:hypothetical protein
MNHSVKIGSVCLAVVVMISCKEVSSLEENESHESDKAGEMAPSSRNDEGGVKGRGVGAAESKVTKLIAELQKSANQKKRRELFAEMMLELPTDEHEIAVEVVVDDLNSDAPANLVSEYLEMSSLMSPALQLPGIVRLLEEPRLLPLQRAAMEQQLRQDLGIPANEDVRDWRLLVADHLRKNEALIAE